MGGQPHTIPRKIVDWFLVLGAWFLVLGAWFFVLGAWFLVLHPSSLILYPSLLRHLEKFKGFVVESAEDGENLFADNFTEVGLCSVRL